ncbi:MAG: DNA repair protein RecN [Tepidisphaeraceae bacterium]
MLRELHISNLAVIADARVELDGGLNCFTGATGAGKSLVIGAVEILLGLRSTSDMLRAGSEEGRVTGVFEVAKPEQFRAIQAVTDIDVTHDGGEVLLVRKLHASGRSSASLNGNPITLQMLKSIGELLVDVHGQHDHQYLLKPSNQLDVLDRFAGLDDLRHQYHETYLKLTDTKRRLAELSTGKKLRAQQLDLLRFQADEIDKAELQPNELPELESRASVLANLEKLRKETSSAYAALYDADGSVIDRLKMIQAVLAELAVVDQQLASTSETLKSGLIQLEEAAFDLGRYTQRLDLDPAELAEVNERLNVINRVLRKYGISVEDALAFRADIGRQIDQLSHADEDADELVKQVAPLEKKLKELGSKLTASRTAAAKKLAPLIVSQLAELGMEKATFSVAVTPLPEPSPSGFDAIEFVVRTNPGLPEQPLRKIASGGEIGRIMLALKGVLAAGDRVSVLVFDEIDANVGGRLGSVIGGKLRDLASHHQVLCITHLPQIAAHADRHITVNKSQSGERTTTTVRTVNGNDRVEEIAEMIGGKKITETTRAGERTARTSQRHDRPEGHQEVEEGVAIVALLRYASRGGSTTHVCTALDRLVSRDRCTLLRRRRDDTASHPAERGARCRAHGSETVPSVGRPH